ncbi:hypothetical protein PBY51_015350 [Eleginops maclovinus]|uniref:Uncharacterized protein n=1 Tax=Eleginops maclovinus TaxID=56733 RepID=A0AAN7X4Q2_ELEMC|nr:hypothetical protein PBY51_015350 [Eleginops maclovinus]
MQKLPWVMWPPVALEAHSRKNLECAYREAKLVSSQCSLSKVSAAQLPSYERFLFAKAWGEQEAMLLGGKEKFASRILL